MPFPTGLPTKTLTFGRYSNALGFNKGGVVKFGFVDPMLHVPTGEVVVGGDETVQIGGDTGIAQVVVPVTVTADLVANWDTASPYTNQRLKVTVDLPGYPGGTKYLDIHVEDPAVMDFDTLTPYSLPGGLTAERAALSSWLGLTGDVTDTDVIIALSGLGYLQRIPIQTGVGSALTFGTVIGTPSDANFVTPPPDGTTVISTTGPALWARVGGVWSQL